MNKLKINITAENKEEYGFVIDLEKDLMRKDRRDKIRHYILKLESVLFRLADKKEPKPPFKFL
jgi:hypothetical protein